MKRNRTQIAALVVAALLTASPAVAHAEWNQLSLGKRIAGPLTLSIVGIAAAGAGVGLFLDAGANFDRLKPICAAKNGCVESEYASYRTEDRASVPLMVGGSVVAVGGLIWLTLEILRAEPPPPKDDGGKDKGASPDPRDPDDNALVFTPILGPSYAGLGVAGRF